MGSQFKSIEHISKLYLTSIEHLSNIYRTSIVLGSIWVGFEWYLGWIWEVSGVYLGGIPAFVHTSSVDPEVSQIHGHFCFFWFFRFFCIWGVSGGISAFVHTSSVDPGVSGEDLGWISDPWTRCSIDVRWILDICSIDVRWILDRLSVYSR